MYSRDRNLHEYTFLRELGTYIPEEFIFLRRVIYMVGNKFPGTFTPALSQELFSPELNSGIIFPSYQREYESWLEIIFLKKFGKFFPAKKFSRNL